MFVLLQHDTSWSSAQDPKNSNSSWWCVGGLYLSGELSNAPVYNISGCLYLSEIVGGAQQRKGNQFVWVLRAAAASAVCISGAFHLMMMVIVQEKGHTYITCQ